MTVRELSLPVGPSQLASESRSVQGGHRLGRRLCLLKGCECPFTPSDPWDRYCSESCRVAARRWRQRAANCRYRASEQGKSARRAQSYRYRQRKRTPDHSPCAGGEGYRQAAAAANFRCRRPGCYRHFIRSRRSPLQKFCSSNCRKALRRVLLREQRWRRVLGLARQAARERDDSW